MEFFETKRASTASRIASLGLTCALVWSAGIAQTAAPPEAPATLNAVDFNFVGQANLGPFPVDSGRLAETKGTSAAIRNYAHLMVPAIFRFDALNVISSRRSTSLCRVLSRCL
jgi:putative membrane protein